MCNEAPCWAITQNLDPSLVQPTYNFILRSDIRLKKDQVGLDAILFDDDAGDSR